MASEKIERNRAERILRRSTDSAIKTMEYCIDVNKESLLTVKGTNTIVEKLSGVYLHHIIAQTDLLILMERVTVAKRDYEKKFFARMLAMHICEFLDDMNTLIGREMLGEFSNVIMEEFVPTFKRLNRQLNLIKKEHGSFLRTIRNKAAAHKTFESLVLAEIIQSIDTNRIFNIACQIRDISIQVVLESTLVDNKIKLIYQMINRATELWNLGYTKAKIKKMMRDVGLLDIKFKK
jgi:hypothetical protein